MLSLKFSLSASLTIIFIILLIYNILKLLFFGFHLFLLLLFYILINCNNIFLCKLDVTRVWKVSTKYHVLSEKNIPWTLLSLHSFHTVHSCPDRSWIASICFCHSCISFFIKEYRMCEYFIILPFVSCKILAHYLHSFVFCFLHPNYIL